MDLVYSSIVQYIYRRSKQFISPKSPSNQVGKFCIQSPPPAFPAIGASYQKKGISINISDSTYKTLEFLLSNKSARETTDLGLTGSIFPFPFTCDEVLDGGLENLERQDKSKFNTPFLTDFQKGIYISLKLNQTAFQQQNIPNCPRFSFFLFHRIRFGIMCKSGKTCFLFGLLIGSQSGYRKPKPEKPQQKQQTE